MTKLINLTPHTLNIVRADSSVLTIEATGKIARVSSKTEVVEVIDGIEVIEQTFGNIVDLPEPEEGTKYIVSRMVKNLVPERKDVLVPGLPVRDDKGNIIGAKGLSY